MSFKRAGNDSSMLHLQKKQRINEVLGLEIPSDEMSVMNDGRFTCLVCNAIPILDTIEILKIHRNSHKHKEKYSKFLEEKQNRLLLIEKKLYEAEQKGKDTFNLLQKKKELISKPRFSARSHSKKLHPKLKIELQPEESQVKEDYRRIKNQASKVSLPQPSSLSRTSCLDKVTSIVHSPALEKFYDFSKLSESERRQIQKDEIYMKSRGWLKDKQGNWIKDPNVEFDSDDDAVA